MLRYRFAPSRNDFIGNTHFKNRILMNRETGGPTPPRAVHSYVTRMLRRLAEGRVEMIGVSLVILFWFLSYWREPSLFFQVLVCPN
jgi:hypothetical protein